jgi:hypothetical protein
MRRQHGHRQVYERRLRADRLQKRDAIHIGHAIVDDDGVYRLPCKYTQRGCAGGHDNGLMAEIQQRLAKAFAKVGVVVDD